MPKDLQSRWRKEQREIGALKAWPSTERSRGHTTSKLWLKRRFEQLLSESVEKLKLNLEEENVNALEAGKLKAETRRYHDKLHWM